MSLAQDVHEKARRIFERINEAFAEKKVTPSPLNYEVWYEYFKGDNPKFRQEMEAILNDDYGYNDRVGRRLYDEFLKKDETPSELDRVFKRLIDAMVKRLTSWTATLESQTQQLDAVAHQLIEPNLNADQLKNLTDSVLSTTHNLRNDSQGFKQALSDATQEIQALRQQLIEARAETMQDELTQIGNRKAFNMTIQDVVEDLADTPERLHLILADIDHFKLFNDQFGHLVGDSVLRYFANTMRRLQKANQTICRYGGEEFAVIVTNSNLEQAIKTAEKIRQTIEKASLKRKNTDEVLPSITASFGVAQYRANESIEDFIGRADQLLYKAKQSGRNQVVSELDQDSE